MQLWLLYEKTGLECFVLGNHYVNSQLNNETDSENNLFPIDLKKRFSQRGKKKNAFSILFWINFWTAAQCFVPDCDKAF